MIRLYTWASVAGLALGGAILSGCKSDRTAQAPRASNSTSLNGDVAQPGNGTETEHGTGHNDQSNSLNGLH